MFPLDDGIDGLDDAQFVGFVHVPETDFSWIKHGGCILGTR